MASRNKVTVVGAGNVGATVAQSLVAREVADISLVDIVPGLPQGKALDLQQAAAVQGLDVRVSGSNDYADTSGSDVIVVTAGLARKPGMSRDDLLFKNAEIVGGILDQVVGMSPDAILVMVTNPLDVMTTLAWKKSKWDARRVMGMAGVLDSARYAAFIALEFGCSVRDVRAMVLGGHGDDMVPIPEYSTVNGIPITRLLSAERVAALNDRTRNGGAEIVKFLGTGSAYYAPGACAAIMVESILRDQHRLLPCCARVDGPYGIRDTYCGVPVKLGRGGVEQVVELALSDAARAALQASAAHVQESCVKLTPQKAAGA